MYFEAFSRHHISKTVVLKFFQRKHCKSEIFWLTNSLRVLVIHSHYQRGLCWLLVFIWNRATFLVGKMFTQIGIWTGKRSWYYCSYHRVFNNHKWSGPRFGFLSPMKDSTFSKTSVTNVWHTRTLRKYWSLYPSKDGDYKRLIPQLHGKGHCPLTEVAAVNRKSWLENTKYFPQKMLSEMF